MSTKAKKMLFKSPVNPISNDDMTVLANDNLPEDQPCFCIEPSEYDFEKHGKKNLLEQQSVSEAEEKIEEMPDVNISSEEPCFDVDDEFQKLKTLQEKSNETFSKLKEQTVNTDVIRNQIYKSHPSKKCEDIIFTDISAKDLMLAWSRNTLRDINDAMYEYYIKNSYTLSELFDRTCIKNYTAFRKNMVELMFEDIHNQLVCQFHLFRPVLKNIDYIIEFFDAVYGITSDEAYIVRKFMHLYKIMPNWNTMYMWDNCQDDIRLACILHLK